MYGSNLINYSEGHIAAMKSCNPLFTTFFSRTAARA